MEFNNIALQAENLTKAYGDTQAINSINLALNENQIIGLIGRNGSGKTTLMKLCAGKLNRTKGALTVLGEDPMDNLKILENIVYTYADLPFDEKLTLKSIIGTYKLMYKTFQEDFALKLLEFYKINKKAKYGSLSRGTKSLFNFICGIATRAPLSMFDEPILAMDITVRRSAYEILLRDYMEYPRTIIISSHILSELENILSEILIIDKGNILFYDSTDNMRENFYRVDGNEEGLKTFTKNKNVIYKSSASLSTFYVVEEPLTEDIKTLAQSKGLQLSRLRPEELYLYLSNNDYEEEMECLWEKKN